ncbi:MAG: four helix bundle protein [Chloroflexota bacterium]
MGVNKFEELIAWQKARELTKQIYKITSQGQFSKDYGLRDQIRRASVSVMSNIAEGFERGSQADFHRFLVIAKASCAEVRSQLYIASDIGYLSNTQFQQLMNLATETSRIIGGLRRSVDPKNT